MRGAKPISRVTRYTNVGSSKIERDSHRASLRSEDEMASPNDNLALLVLVR